jgi:hypothetical protein
MKESKIAHLRNDSGGILFVVSEGVAQLNQHLVPRQITFLALVSSSSPALLRTSVQAASVIFSPYHPYSGSRLAGCATKGSVSPTFPLALPSDPESLANLLITRNGIYVGFMRGRRVGSGLLCCWTVESAVLGA